MASRHVMLKCLRRSYIKLTIDSFSSHRNLAIFLESTHTGLKDRNDNFFPSTYRTTILIITKLIYVNPTCSTHSLSICPTSMERKVKVYLFHFSYLPRFQKRSRLPKFIHLIDKPTDTMRITVPDFNRKNAVKLMRKAVNYGTAYVGRNLEMNKYVFTPPAPIAVRDKVKTKNEKSKRGLCLQEMALMLACWNEHDYSESICAKEMQNFEKCWKEGEQQYLRLKEEERLGISSSGRLTSGQANTLLKRFPEPTKT